MCKHAYLPFVETCLLSSPFVNTVRFAHVKLLIRATNNTKRRLLLLQGSLGAHDFNRAFSEVINKVAQN